MTRSPRAPYDRSPTSSRSARQLEDAARAGSPPAQSHRRRRTASAPDLAFADTVIVDDLADAMPASGIVFNDETGAEHRVTPVAFPPAAAQALSRAAGLRPGIVTRFRVGWTRMRHGMSAQKAEMTLLWSATAALDPSCGPTHAGHADAEESPLVRPSVGRRVRTLFSFFEWDRADLLRAAWIGLAVFFLAATVGAIFLQVGS